MAEIFIISGPSGVGKDTLIKKMMPKLQNVFLSVSYTTRPPRKGEIDNVDYRFVSDSFFREEIKNGNMLEYADYCTVCYGTPKQPVEQALKEGRHVILKIERAGMESVKKVYNDFYRPTLARRTTQQNNPEKNGQRQSNRRPNEQSKNRDGKMRRLYGNNDKR